MYISVFVQEGLVYIDGEGLSVDCSRFGNQFDSLYWDGQQGVTCKGELPPTIITSVESIESLLNDFHKLKVHYLKRGLFNQKLIPHLTQQQDIDQFITFVKTPIEEI